MSIGGRIGKWLRFADLGDAVLASNRTRRVDFALFMVEALTDDDLVQVAPAIVGCKSESALANT